MTEEQAKALAWMAFCKGAACAGNRDIGELEGYVHKDGTPMRGYETFNEWWARYGRADWQRSQ